MVLLYLLIYNFLFFKELVVCNGKQQVKKYLNFNDSHMESVFENLIETFRMDYFEIQIQVFN